MSISMHSGKSNRIIDLDGPDGNAFAILGIAQKNFRQMETDPKPYLDEMRSGDYYNLVAVFDKYFGTVYQLKTSNPELLEQIKAAKQGA